MTLLERIQARADREMTDTRRRSRQGQPRTNVSSSERAVSIAAGAILALQGLSRRSVPGYLIAGVGGMMLYRGISGHCHVYGALGLNAAEAQERQGQSTDELAQRGIHVEQAFLINRSPEDLYQYWRNFENLPGIMTHLQSVRILDTSRSHWVAQAPRLAGGSVEWDAEITRDEPNSLIAWRSLPGSQVETAGEIRFSPALGDRGTEVHVSMQYLPPAGKLGHWLATLVGEAPRRQMRDDLRNFKRLMETGEIPTIVGQPRGTCAGEGKRETE